MITQHNPALETKSLRGGLRSGTAPFERKDENTDVAAAAKKAVDGLMTAFDEFKKTNDLRLAEIEKKGGADVLTVDKLSKIDKTLDSFEGLNQRLTTLDAQQKAIKEQQGAFDALLGKLEAKMGRPALSVEQRRIELKQKVNDWGRAVILAHTQGIPNLSAEQQKALADVAAEYKAMTVSNDTTGGYLAPVEFVAEIIKAVVLISPVRSLVRVYPTANKSRQVPKRTGTFSAQRTTEQGTRSETTGLTYGLEEITAPEMYALVDISNENLEDSAFDMEAELRGEASEQFAVREGYEFVSGTGIGEMQGILTNVALAGTTIGVNNSGSAALLTADGVLSTFYGIKTAYAQRASWICNRLTLGSIRKLKDGQGQYLWMPGIANGQPNTINSAPYVEMPDMPNEGANAYPLAFGDWQRAYAMVDRIAMTFLRDPFTQATSGNVRMHFRRRVGGKVMLGEAIRLNKCST